MIGITGATGLLGSELMKQLSAEGIPFFGIKRESSDTQLVPLGNIAWRHSDILDVESLREAFKGASVIIHTAALVSFNSGDREALYRTNVEGTRNVVNLCLELGIPRLIHISSVAALGRQKGLSEVNEDHKWVDNKLNSDYAESKYLAELEVFRAQEEGLQVDIINPSVIFSQSNWHRSSAQIFKYVWKGKPFYTDGNINYVDIRDVISIILKFTQRAPSGVRWIINGGSAPLKEVLTTVATQFNKNPPSIRVPKALISTAARVESVRSWISGTAPLVTVQSARSAQEKIFYNNQKVVTELGMKFRSLDETLQWCCSYYLQNATTNY